MAWMVHIYFQLTLLPETSLAPWRAKMAGLCRRRVPTRHVMQSSASLHPLKELITGRAGEFGQDPYDWTEPQPRATIHKVANAALNSHNTVAYQTSSLSTNALNMEDTEPLTGSIAKHVREMNRQPLGPSIARITRGQGIYC
jgi:hypothetical protein